MPAIIYQIYFQMKIRHNTTIIVICEYFDAHFTVFERMYDNKFSIAYNFLYDILKRTYKKVTFLQIIEKILS